MRTKPSELQPAPALDIAGADIDVTIADKTPDGLDIRSGDVGDYSPDFDFKV